MNKIEQRIFKELFVEKKVKLDQELYMAYYLDIWFCENYFKEFLQSQDSSVKIDFAKKIFKYFNAHCDIVIPSFMIEDLIYVQQHELVSNNLYIPQDHLVHSINLYILGIYTFFNVNVFHWKILNESKQKVYINKLRAFIFEWKLFALYHDIGYIIEGYVDQSGKCKNQEITNKYLNFSPYLIYESCLKSMAKLITNIYIINQSTDKFEMNHNIYNFEWATASKAISSHDLQQRLSQYSNFFELKGVNSPNEVAYVLGILQTERILVVYEDKLGIPLAFEFKEDESKSEIILNVSLSEYKKYFAQKNFCGINLNCDDILCKYYTLNLRNKIKNIVPPRYKNEVLEYYNCLPYNLKKQISLIEGLNSINYIYDIIYQWLYQNSNINFFNSSFNCTHEQKKLKEAFIITFEKKIKERIDAVIAQDISTEKIKNILIKELSKISYKKINTLAEKLYNDTLGLSAPIYHNVKNLFDKVCKEISSPSEYLIKEDDIIKLAPFRCNNETTISCAISEKIQKFSKQLNINFDELISYKTNYTTCDHGIVSASILFQTISISEKILAIAADNPILYFSYANINNPRKIPSNELLLSYSKVIFSILLHNIYTKSSKSYGIVYKQDIDKNAFSYFASFMDALQLWGRPKQLELSVVNLPSEHYLGSDFDIIFSEKNIKIIFSSEVSGYMRNHMNNLEEYLPGISYIIKLEEKEI